MDGQIVMNPNQAQKHASKLDLTVAATGDKVVMIEAGADELPDEIMYDGHREGSRGDQGPSGLYQRTSWPRSARRR